MLSRASVVFAVVALGGSVARGATQPAVASAAAVAATYTVTGTVVNQEGTTLADAEVSLLQHDSVTRRVRTDANGRFRVEGLTEASNVFRVRRLGYHAKTISVHIVTADRMANVFVTLDPSVASLDPMRVVDDEDDYMPPLDARLEGFYKRAQSNSFGRYITEAMIEKAHPQWVSELMRTLPGVMVRPNKATPDSRSRFGNTVRFRNCGVQWQSSEKVGPLVWVDGVRMPGAELDDVTQGNDVAAIEVYPSLAGIPAQFFDRSAVCGTILVWTKAR
jgi:hypothetical protein